VLLLHCQNRWQIRLVAVDPCSYQKFEHWLEMIETSWYCLQLQWLTEDTASELHGKQYKHLMASKSLKTTIMISLGCPTSA
jgi:hypothetical protein